MNPDAASFLPPLKADAQTFIPLSQSSGHDEKHSMDPHAALCRPRLKADARPFVPPPSGNDEKRSMNPVASSFLPYLKLDARPFVQASSEHDEDHSIDPDAATFIPSLKVDAQPFVSPSSEYNEGIVMGTPLRVHGNQLMPTASSSRVQICRFFRQGACKRGLDCHFRHDSMECNITGGITEELDDYPTIEYDLDEGIHCCFGPGLSVVRLDLGDSCQEEDDVNSIAISGLPTSVSECDVEARLSAYGSLLNMSAHSAQKDADLWFAFATFSSPLSAAEAVRALNGSTAKSWIGLVDSMKRSGRKATRQRWLSEAGIVSVVMRKENRRSEAVSVKVQWFLPSSGAWAHYSQQWQAERVSKLINGKTVSDRIIEAKFQQPTARQTTSFSVWIGNLSDSITHATLVTALNQISKIRCSSLDIKRPNYSERSCPSIVQTLLSKFGPLAAFDIQPVTKGSASLKRRALVRFVNNEDAGRACEHFCHAQNVPELGGTKMFVERIFSLKYTLPLAIFPLVRKQIDEACATVGNVRPKVFENKNSFTINIHSDDQKSIDKIKSCLAQIVEGEILRDPSNGNRVVWGRHIDLSRNQHILSELIAAAGATAWVDTRRQEIRVFGPTDNRTKLKNALLEFHKEAMLETHAVPILSSEFDYILRTGRSALEKATRASGAKSISLNIKARSLLITGDVQEARKAGLYISKLASGVNETGNDDALCPVCFCPPEDPTVLSCDDIYCRDCFDAWLGGSCVRDHPLTCLKGDCDKKVLLRDLQKHLPSAALVNTLRFAVDDHVRKNPGKYQFCITPTCPGIYELHDATRVSTCSTCRLEICTDCNVSHGSSSCKDYRLASMPPNVLRMKIVDQILTLRCPRCRQAFLDFTGCFALRCNMCPCGFCGWCLKDCGSDAHSHVINECKAKPLGHRDYFGTFDQFQAAQNANRKKDLISFLSSQSAAEKVSCLSSLERDLADLGIVINISDL